LYLEKIVELTKRVKHPEVGGNYPPAMAAIGTAIMVRTSRPHMHAPQSLAGQWRCYDGSLFLESVLRGG
jgi:hypothetical protein